MARSPQAGSAPMARLRRRLRLDAQVDSAAQVRERVEVLLRARAERTQRSARAATEGDEPVSRRPLPVRERSSASTIDGPARPAPFAIRAALRGDGTTVVSVRGELDVSTSPKLRAALDALAAQRRPAVLDLAALEFMECTGLAVVVGASVAAERHGWSFAVSPDLPAAVARLLEFAPALGVPFG